MLLCCALLSLGFLHRAVSQSGLFFLQLLECPAGAKLVWTICTVHARDREAGIVGKGHGQIAFSHSCFFLESCFEKVAHGCGPTLQPQSLKVGFPSHSLHHYNFLNTFFTARLATRWLFCLRDVWLWLMGLPLILPHRIA